MVYERKGFFYIRASSKTTAGVWVDDGDCYEIDINSDNEVIGKYIGHALNNSYTEIAHPTNWGKINIPLFNVAKVKSWSVFGKGAKCIIVCIDEDIQINPTINKSNIKQGFVVKEGNIISLPIDISYVELGKHIKEAWSFCE